MAPVIRARSDVRWLARPATLPRVLWPRHKAAQAAKSRPAVISIGGEGLQRHCHGRPAMSSTLGPSRCVVSLSNGLIALAEGAMDGEPGHVPEPGSLTGCAGSAKIRRNSIPRACALQADDHGERCAGADCLGRVSFFGTGFRAGTSFGQVPEPRRSERRAGLPSPPCSAVACAGPVSFRQTRRDRAGRRALVSNSPVVERGCEGVEHRDSVWTPPGTQGPISV